MNSMIERVAAALCVAAHDGDDGDGARDWNSNQDVYRDMAVAAIKAMREPTERMRWERDGWNASPNDIEAGYQAMIDAALEEKPE